MSATIGNIPHELISIILLQTYPQISRLVCRQWHELLIGRKCYLCRELIRDDKHELLKWACDQGYYVGDEVIYWITVYGKSDASEIFYRDPLHYYYKLTPESHAKWLTRGWPEPMAHMLCMSGDHIAFKHASNWNRKLCKYMTVTSSLDELELAERMGIKIDWELSLCIAAHRHSPKVALWILKHKKCDRPFIQSMYEHMSTPLRRIMRGIGMTRLCKYAAKLDNKELLICIRDIVANDEKIQWSRVLDHASGDTQQWIQAMCLISRATADNVSQPL